MKYHNMTQEQHEAWGALVARAEDALRNRSGYINKMGLIGLDLVLTIDQNMNAAADMIKEIEDSRTAITDSQDVIRDSLGKIGDLTESIDNKLSK